MIDDRPQPGPEAFILADGEAAVDTAARFVIVVLDVEEVPLGGVVVGEEVEGSRMLLRQLGHDGALVGAVEAVTLQTRVDDAEVAVVGDDGRIFGQRGCRRRSASRGAQERGVVTGVVQFGEEASRIVNAGELAEMILDGTLDAY